MVNTVKDGDACPWRANPATQPFKISIVESLGRAMPIVQYKSLKKMSNWVISFSLKTYSQ
jgi:hypothetical protein